MFEASFKAQFDGLLNRIYINCIVWRCQELLEVCTCVYELILVEHPNGSFLTFSIRIGDASIDPFNFQKGSETSSLVRVSKGADQTH